jgi:plastocyanin
MAPQSDGEERGMIGKLTIPLVAVGLFAAACGEQPTARPGGGGGTPAGPETIQVEATEYKFGGVPGTLSAGPVTFTLENVGQEPHVFSLVRIEGDQSVEELVELPPNQAQKLIEEIGDTFAQPGQEGKPLRTELTAGRYGYACFVTTKDGTPHAALGMVGELTVA